MICVACLKYCPAAEQMPNHEEQYFFIWLCRYGTAFVAENVKGADKMFCKPAFTFEAEPKGILRHY